MGSSTTPENFEVYESDSSIAHFVQFASIYATLSDYRNGLIDDAVTSGLPLGVIVPLLVPSVKSLWPTRIFKHALAASYTRYLWLYA